MYDEDFDKHFHLYPGDWVQVPDVPNTKTHHDIKVAGIYRVNRDGTIEPWGPVAPEDRCKYCMSEFAKAVAP